MAAEDSAASEVTAPASDEPFDMTNKSVIKATVLLSELGRHRQGITVTELAQAVRMTRPTAFRLLLSLEQTGFVDRVDNRYKLGWQMARLGRLADPMPGRSPGSSPSSTTTPAGTARPSASPWRAGTLPMTRSPKRRGRAI